MNQLTVPVEEDKVNLYDATEPNDLYCVAENIHRAKVEPLWEKYLEEEGLLGLDGTVYKAGKLF